jgi:glycosyltransferase involved in cell wall biosynthesis
VTRVLFVVNHSDFFVSHRLPLGIAARARGWDVHVATGPGGGQAAIEEHGLAYHPVAMRRSSARPLDELGTLRALGALYRRLRPDIIHHVTIKPVLYGGIVSTVLRVPAVVHAISGLGYIFLAQGAAAEARRTAVRLAYRAAFRHPNMRVIFQNTHDRDAFVDGGLVRARDAVLVAGSGVDLDTFIATQEPPSDPMVVVLPARMLRDKGIVELVDAARMLKRRGVRVVVRLAGPTDPGNPASIDERDLRQWEAEGAIEWLGRVDDMAGLMQKAHVICLPSYREGLSKALIEAAASARPIVTTDAPGCSDVVRHRDNGLLVPLRDAGAIADALAELAADADLRRAMGARGRARAIAEFALPSVVEKTFEIYEGLLARGRQGA